jgi:hypothetical protein
MAEVAEWKFDRGGWLQVYENAERAGAGSCTLAVSNLDEQLPTLRKKASRQVVQWSVTRQRSS